MKAPVYALAAILAVSCNNKNQIEQIDTANTAGSEIKELCYLDVTQSKNDPAIIDTMSLTVSINGKNVTGIYNWLPYEKDRKTGTYTGTINDSVVNAIYTYNSEGQVQKEELIFKLNNQTALIKFGEMVEQNGIWKFKDSKTAKFNTVLKQTACK